MKNSKLIYPLLLFINVSFWSCTKNQCEEPVGPDNRTFSFRLIDPNTNETAISAWGAKFDYEDLEFKQESKDTIRGLQILGSGDFSFYLIDDIRPNNLDDLIDKPFSNTYYLYLDAKNATRETDIDTIVINSEIITVDRKCEPIDFGTTTIMYNDSIYHQGDFISQIEFIKNH